MYIYLYTFVLNFALLELLFYISRLIFDILLNDSLIELIARWHSAYFVHICMFCALTMPLHLHFYGTTFVLCSL